MSTLAKNLLLVSAVSIFTLAGVELLLQQTEYRYFYKPYYNKFPDYYFQNDVNLGADHAPNREPQWFDFHGPKHKVSTNSFGCFDYDREIEEEYILAVGDSNTWGYSPLEHMWTSHLESKLGKQIVKCGVSGTGTKYQIIKAKQVIEKIGINPSAIILMYTVANDFNDDVAFPDHTVFEGQRLNNFKYLDLQNGEVERRTLDEIKQNYSTHQVRIAGFKTKLKSKFIIAALFDNFIDQLKKYKNPQSSVNITDSVIYGKYERNLLDLNIDQYPWIEQKFHAHISNLRRFKLVTEKYGAKFVIVSTGKFTKANLSKRLKNTFANEFNYFHVKDDLNGTPTRHRFDSHWNKNGNRLAAERIQHYLNHIG